MQFAGAVIQAAHPPPTFKPGAAHMPITDLPGDSIPESLDSESPLNQVFNRCQVLGLPMTWRISDTGGRRYHYLLVQFPAGRGTHQIFVTQSNAAELLAIDFSQIEFFADFDGYIDRSTGIVKCSVSPGYYRDLSDIPGASKIDPSIPTTPGDYKSERNWKYEVSREDLTIGLTQPSALDEALLRRAYAVFFLSGIDLSDIDLVCSQMELLSSSFFFDLDVNFDLPQTLSRKSNLLPVPSPALARSPLPFPVNEYPKEPASLYFYGRTSFGMPLVEFLAYYQCMEYFFPVYANREAATRLRMVLTDPRFRLSEDESVVRAISAVLPLASRRATERELLRLVIRGISTAQVIRELIESNPAFTEHFCTKSQALSGAERLNLADGAPDLRDQVADRIYQIRCRIVHTKFEGGEESIDLLLPTSREVRSLTPDLTMLRMLARQALIANSQSLN